MNTPTHNDTIDQLVTFALQRDVPVTMMALERNGIIIGGLILVTGEKNYTAVKTCIRPAPLPAPQPSTLNAPANPQPSTP
jgi:hypothetical protein